MKPILGGRNIKRYTYEWTGNWLIYARKGINIEYYSAIYEYLLKHKTKLIKKTGVNKWYELQASPSNLFDRLIQKNKIIWIQLVDEGRFALDDNSYFCIDSTFCITGENLQYLTVLLNSNIVSWYFKLISPTTGMGTSQWKKIYVEKIPIPKLSYLEQTPFIETMSEITNHFKYNTHIDWRTLDNDIQNNIYQLYNLSKSEIEVIKKIK